MVENAATDSLNPELKNIINSVLSTDSRKHYRYCPCCRKYADDELTVDQMGEFIEYIR